MMKYIVLLLAMCMTAQFCSAQEDSLVFAHAAWNIKKIAAGIELRQCWFDHSLFGSSQNISILEIKMNRKNRIDVEADSAKLMPTSTFGIQHDAVAALNGTFFDMKNGGSVDYIRMDGKTLNETRLSKTNARIFHQKAAIITKKGKVSIQQWDGSANWEDNLTGEDIMTTGPLLIKNHQRVDLDTVSFYVMRHPRSAMALKGNKVLLIAVDGRNQRAAGMTLKELASILQWLDTGTAINLDGGGSTTLWINNFPEGGVINYPSDNKKMEKSAAFKPGTDLDNLAADTQKWDHTGQRPVANVILVNKKNRPFLCMAVIKLKRPSRYSGQPLRYRENQ